MRGLSLQVSVFAALAACAQAAGPQQDGAAVKPGPPTYYQDVRPILNARCVPCHKPGEIAPFALVTYDDAKQNATAVVQATTSRRMPPFPPSTTGCEPLADARIMPDSERDALAAWAKAGAPKGDAAHPGPELPEAAGLLGEPSDRWDMGVDYTPAPPSGELDDYHCFVIDPHATDVIPFHAIDVAAGHRAIAHHASIYVASTTKAIAAARALDDGEPGPGYSCFGDTRVDGVDEIGGWVPGQPPQAYPANAGGYLRPGSVFVLQMHYNIATGIASDRSTIRLWRPAPSAPLAEEAGGFDVEDYYFQIPPRSRGITAAGTVEVIGANDVIRSEGGQTNAGLLWQVGLHSHLLGKAMRMDLIHADGSSQCLLDIPTWQFGWQGSYDFANAVTLAPTDRIKVTCTWDNPTDRIVTYGNGSSEEMCQGWGITTSGQ